MHIYIYICAVGAATPGLPSVVSASPLLPLTGTLYLYLYLPSSCSVANPRGLRTPSLLRVTG